RKKLSALRLRVRDYDQRVRQLEHDEREVARDRELLDRESADLETRVQQGEAELARQREDFGKECRAREQRLEHPEGEAARGRELLDRASADLEARVRQGEAELARRREGFGEECREREQRLAAAEAAAAQGAEGLRRLQSWQGELEERQQRLNERER